MYKKRRNETSCEIYFLNIFLFFTFIKRLTKLCVHLFTMGRIGAMQRQAEGLITIISVFIYIHVIGFLKIP